MQHISKYFPRLTAEQTEQFAAILRLYPEWNEKINVVSRKDIDNLELHHILHSLSIAKFIDFKPGTRILDLGTGGGFPAIPLAIVFPQVTFHLVDRIGKKLRVAQTIAEEIGLANVSFQHGDVKEVKGKFDFVVSRAVMDLGAMMPLVKPLIAPKGVNALPNGVICLKGGDLTAEVAPFKQRALVENINTYFNEDYFETKKIVYIAR